MPSAPITFRYAGVRVHDLERALRFYQGLGLRVRRRGTMEHGGVWVQLALPHQVPRLELNYYPPSNPHYEPFRQGTELDHLGFRVDDVDAWVRRALRLGARPLLRFDETGESLGYVTDPDGICLEFFGPRRRRPARRKLSQTDSRRKRRPRNVTEPA